MKLSQKELSRADNGYTAVVRPSKGGWNVGMVKVETGLPVFKMAHVLTREEVGKAIASDLRMMDKCGFACKMATNSRSRA